MKKLALTGNLTKDKETIYRFIHENGLRGEAKKMLEFITAQVKLQPKKQIKAQTPRKQLAAPKITMPTAQTETPSNMANELRDIKASLGVNQEDFANKINALAKKKNVNLGFKLTRAVLSCMINQSRPVKSIVLELAKEL